MDWSQFDPEGAARQRFLEIDDMVEQIDDLVRFSDWTKDELVNTLDVSWLHHENGLGRDCLCIPRNPKRGFAS